VGRSRRPSHQPALVRVQAQSLRCQSLRMAEDERNLSLPVIGWTGRSGCMSAQRCVQPPKCKATLVLMFMQWIGWFPARTLRGHELGISTSVLRLSQFPCGEIMNPI